jgi:hypothetical protein
MQFDPYNFNYRGYVGKLHDEADRGTTIFLFGARAIGPSPLLPGDLDPSLAAPLSPIQVLQISNRAGSGQGVCDRSAK